MIVNDLTNIAVNAAQDTATGKGLSRRKARPDELILIVPLSTTESEYEIVLDDSEYRNIPNAKGLKDRDGFVATGAAIGVLPVPIVNGNEQFTAANPVYYNDPEIFDTPAADPATELSEAQAINAIHHGRMDVRTNEALRIDNFPLRRFRTVQEPGGSAGDINQETGDEVKSLGAVVSFKGGDDNAIVIRFFCRDKALINGDADRNNYLYVRLIGASVKGDTTASYTK